MIYMARSDSDKIKEVKQLIPVLENILSRGVTTDSYTSGYEAFQHSIKTLIKPLKETTK